MMKKDKKNHSEQQNDNKVKKDSSFNILFKNWNANCYIQYSDL